METLVPQGLAIGQLDGNEASDSLAIFDWVDGDGNFVALLQRMNGPALVRHVRRVAGLDDPVFELALVILVIEFHEAVRVGPKPVRDGSLHSDGLRSLEGGRAVMGESRYAGNPQAGQHESDSSKIISHAPSKFRLQIARTDCSFTVLKVIVNSLIVQTEGETGRLAR